MKNVEDIIVLGLLFFLGVFGLYSLVSGVSSLNPNLDSESQAIVSNYDDFYLSAKNNASNVFDGDKFSEQESNTGVDAFYRSISEAKSTADKFKIVKNIFWGFPKALIASIPLVPIEASGFIVGIIYGVIGMFAFIAIFKMWFGGNTNN